MSTAGTIDLPLEVFSGYVSDIAPSDLPAGASPNNQDVAFPLGGWRTRPGLGAGVFNALAGNPTINYQKTFIDQQLNKRLLFLDSTGNLTQEFPFGTLTPNINSIQVPANTSAKSATAYGTEYIAFSDGQFGIGDPSQWNGTFYDRVSQVGPCVSPNALDEVGSIAIASVSQEASIPVILAFEYVPNLSFVSSSIVPGAPTIHVAPASTFTIAGVGAAYDGTHTTPPTTPTTGSNFTTSIDVFFTNPTSPTPILGAGGTIASSYTTFQTATPHGLQVGQNAIIAGVGGGYDGTFKVMAVLDSTHFTVFEGATGLAPLGAGGTIALGGNINAGVHQVSVFYITRSGYWTKPAPPIKWTAAGGKRVTLTNIPIGPPNVVARVLIFTTAAGATFFFTTDASNELGTGNMVINDNVTGTFTVDFTDTILAAGSNVQYLFSLLDLEESAGVVSYATRLFWWGGRNRVPNLLNMSFDAGFQGGNINVPNGWIPNPAFPGGSLYDNPAVTVSGFSYGMLNTPGVSTDSGLIQQSIYQDYLGNTILKPSTQYSVRVKLARSNIAATGLFTVELFSPTAGSLAIVTVESSTGTFPKFQEFIVPFNNPTPAVIPIDAVVRIFTNFQVLAGTFAVYADSLEIFPTNVPYLSTTMRASLAGQPESYAELTGVIQPFFQDGGTIRTAFVLREKLYILKDSSWYVTQDDGANEPSAWTVSTVSGAVGAAGPNCADLGEDWAVVANRNGPYIFWGGEPIKVGQEIQSDASNSGKNCWSTINWDFGHTIWVLVDKSNKRVLIGAPVAGATSPNVIFYFDYRGSDTVSGTIGQAIADHWSVKYSSYTGKMLAIGNAPKWSLWNISSNSAALVERADGTTHTFIGNGAAAVNTGVANTGKIYDLLDSNKNDDGAGIPWFYSTYYTPSHMDEQALQIKSHRKLFAYLAGSVRGSGQMAITMQPTGNITAATNAPLQLVDINASNAITSISRVNGIVTVTCAGGHGLTDGIDVQALIHNAADASFNGTVPIMAIPNATQFLFAQYLLPDLILGAGGTVARLWREFEFTTNILGERVSYTFSNNGSAPNCWAEMEKLIFSIVPDPWSPVRGSVY